jgi:16S rRNA (uracil1498-N3)-methyltransferase
MQRFVLRETKFTQELIIDDETLLHQFFSVLRYKLWDQVIFFDGKSSTDYVYEISEIKAKKYVKLLWKDIINKAITRDSFHLYQALPNKIEKIEHILQKWVEVGITAFTFFRSERSQTLMINSSKQTRLEKIVREALEQSGRNMLPSLEFIQNIPSSIAWNTLFFHTNKKESSLLANIEKKTSYNILVGPEGGWSEREERDFIEKGYRKIYLWEGILRTETVAPVVTFFLSQI